MVTSAKDDNSEWLNSYPSAQENNSPKTIEDMPRDSVMEALTRGGVGYNNKAPVGRLREKLRRTLVQVLESRAHSFEKDAPLQDLLKLVETH